MRESAKLGQSDTGHAAEKLQINRSKHPLYEMEQRLHHRHIRYVHYADDVMIFYASRKAAENIVAGLKIM